MGFYLYTNYYIHWWFINLYGLWYISIVIYIEHTHNILQCWYFIFLFNYVLYNLFRYVPKTYQPKMLNTFVSKIKRLLRAKHKSYKTSSYKIVGIVVENIFRDQNLPRFITLIWVKIPVSTRAEKMYCNFPLTSISFYGSYYDVPFHLIIFLIQYHHNMQ